MSRCGSIWLPLLLPASVFGLLAAAGATWFGESPGPVWLTFAGGLAGLWVSAARISRQNQAARARLRNPELRQQPHHVGLFGPLLNEAVSLLEEREQQAATATRAKTELEARTHSLRNQVRRLEGALNQVGMPVFMTDSRGQFLFWNEPAAALLQIESDRGPLAGRPHLHQLADQFESLTTLIAELRGRNTTDSRAAELELDGGRVYRAVARQLPDEEGRSSATSVILQDICEERQEKTRHAEFVSSVAHELKTPMAGIKAYTELLMDGDVDDPAEQQELYRFIDGQVDRLTRLVNNMLNLARIESGVIKLQREDCELNAVLQKAFQVVEPTAAEKQIALVPELSDLYIPVHVDPDLFSQAIINLLSNAVKYTPPGGEVRLRSRMEEKQAVIEVRDTGLGIPEDSLPKLFQRFYRVPENNKAAAGTGLGLALVHYIVTNTHGGTISVASKVNEGSCFTVAIPLGHLQRVRKRPEPAVCTN